MYLWWSEVFIWDWILEIVFLNVILMSCWWNCVIVFFFLRWIVLFLRLVNCVVILVICEFCLVVSVLRVLCFLFLIFCILLFVFVSFVFVVLSFNWVCLKWLLVLWRFLRIFFWCVFNIDVSVFCLSVNIIGRIMVRLRMFVLRILVLKLKFFVSDII